MKKIISLLFCLLLGFGGISMATITHDPYAGVYYTDEHGVTYEMGTITINNGGNTMTILDRDLGAKKYGFISFPSGKINENISDDALGFAFQRGNNYGFKTYKGEIPELLSENYNEYYILRDTDITGTIQVNASNYGPYNYYSSNVFFIGENNETEIIGGIVGNNKHHNWDSSKNDNLRGGAGTSELNHFGLDDIEYTALDRQGPCPLGYHVPSRGEWEELYRMRKGVDELPEATTREAEGFAYDFLFPAMFSAYWTSDKPCFSENLYKTSSDVAIINCNNSYGDGNCSFSKFYFHSNDHSKSAYIRCFKNPKNTYESQYPNMKITLKSGWNVVSVPTEVKSISFSNGGEGIIFAKLVDGKWVNVPVSAENIVPLEGFLVYSRNGKGDVNMYIIGDLTSDVSQNTKALKSGWNLLGITTPTLPFNKLSGITNYLDFTKYNGINSSNSIGTSRDSLSNSISNYELGESYGIFLNGTSNYQGTEYQYTTNNYYKLCELNLVKTKCNAGSDDCPFRCRGENYYIDCSLNEIKAKCYTGSEECPFACREEKYICSQGVINKCNLSPLYCPEVCNLFKNYNYTIDLSSSRTGSFQRINDFTIWDIISLTIKTDSNYDGEIYLDSFKNGDNYNLYYNKNICNEPFQLCTDDAFSGSLQGNNHQNSPFFRITIGDGGIHEMKPFVRFKEPGFYRFEFSDKNNKKYYIEFKVSGGESGNLSVRNDGENERKVIKTGITDIDSLKFSYSENLSIYQLIFEKYGNSTNSGIVSIRLENDDGIIIADKQKLNDDGYVTLTLKEDYRTNIESATLVVETENIDGSTLGFDLKYINSSAQNVDLTNYIPHLYDIVSYESNYVTINNVLSGTHYEYSGGEFYELLSFDVESASISLVKGFKLSNNGNINIKNELGDVIVKANNTNVVGLSKSFNSDGQLLLSFDDVEIPKNGTKRFKIFSKLPNLNEYGKFIKLLIASTSDINIIEKKNGIRMGILMNDVIRPEIYFDETQ